MWSQKALTPFYHAVSCRLAWAGRGKRDWRCYLYHLLLLLLLRLSRVCPCALHSEGEGGGAGTRHGLSSSVPLAAVFGPCLDAVAVELAAGRGLVSVVSDRARCRWRLGGTPCQLTSLLYSPLIPILFHSLATPSPLASPRLPTSTRGQAMLGHGPPYTI